MPNSEPRPGGPLDPLSAKERRRVMQAVGREDTAPELKLRRALWHEGLRYRLRRRVAGCRPDLSFVGPQVAVFVDGCFWHGCPEHYSAPANNAEYWREKVRKNRERDRRNDRDLRDEGWAVLRFWSCEVKSHLERVVEEVRSNVETAPS